MVESILKGFLQIAIIEKKTRLSESAYHIRIKSESIKDVDFIPGYFLRLAIGFNKEKLSLKDKVRSYSIWDIDKNTGCIDLAIATHSTGIGTEWAEHCREGELVYFKWKKGKFLINDTADSYLMIGDLSALSHMYVLNRHLPKNKETTSILYSQNKRELFPDIDGTIPFDFYKMPQNPCEEIINRVRQIVPKMRGSKMVYIGGDSRICIALNQYFRKELRWETNQIKTKPFWNPDKRGLE